MYLSFPRLFCAGRWLAQAASAKAEQDMRKAAEGENFRPRDPAVTSVILINCGGIVDLVTFFKLEDNTSLNM